MQRGTGRREEQYRKGFVRFKTTVPGDIHRDRFTPFLSIECEHAGRKSTPEICRISIEMGDRWRHCPGHRADG